MTNSGIYIHLPFCKKKCNYCDFISFAAGKEEYQKSLLAEIAATKELPQTELDTVFTGGGTPSVLPVDYIAAIMDELYEYRVSAAAEITMEVNPATVNAESLRDYRQAGINRLSFGLQAVQSDLLAKLGRIHSYEDFIKNYYAAKEAGFDNISVDLMFSLPGQTLDNWLETLQTVIMLKPQHISAYGLIIEESTNFGQMLKRGEIFEADEAVDREMYWSANKILAANGYERYEISNFALSGCESRHNMKYWTRAEYIGLGLNAHSFINERRYSNTSYLREYISANGQPELIRTEELLVNVKDAMSEFMFLGLRMTKGVSKKAFYNKFGQHIEEVYGRTVEKFIELGLLARQGDNICLTDRGVDVSNRVMAEFVL